MWLVVLICVWGSVILWLILVGLRFLCFNSVLIMVEVLKLNVCLVWLFNCWNNCFLLVVDVSVLIELVVKILEICISLFCRLSDYFVCVGLI